MNPAPAFAPRLQGMRTALQRERAKATTEEHAAAIDDLIRRIEALLGVAQVMERIEPGDPIALRPVTVDRGRAINERLIAFGVRFELDGDLLRCRGCMQALIASRDGEEMNHRACRWHEHKHPWRELRELLAEAAAAAGSTA